MKVANKIRDKLAKRLENERFVKEAATFFALKGVGFLTQARLVEARWCMKRSAAHIEAAMRMRSKRHKWGRGPRKIF